jgi:hypothetical protein
VTTLSPADAPTERIVQWGHQRSDIENHGFNELVQGWRADHLYKHEAPAIECFLLTVFLAYNAFHALLALNLKPVLRAGKTEMFWAQILAAELCCQVAETVLNRSP